MKKSCYTPESIATEVASDLTKMFTQQGKMSDEYTYGRISSREFAQNRKKYKQANITGWFGWENSYRNIIAARILRNNGYVINQPIYMLHITADDSKIINAEIQSAIDTYLDNIIQTKQ